MIPNNKFLLSTLSTLLVICILLDSANVGHKEIIKRSSYAVFNASLFYDAKTYRLDLMVNDFIYKF